MIQLTASEAFLRLREMLQADAAPTLSNDEVLSLLELARRADDHGRAPSEDGWDPTWDLNAAAAEGWRRKAGKVAGRFDVTLDGSSLRRAQTFAHCLQQAEEYARRLASTARLTPHDIDDVDVIGN